MSHPTIMSKSRKLGYKFMVAEAYWILTGKNTVADISPYSKQISRFSDDNIYFSGAYGPKVVDQFTYVVDSLWNDCHCRQAVINIWRENPRGSKDIPCTLSLQFIIRDSRLNCVATMRSSDAWLGWVYDVFNFSMISAHVRQMLMGRDQEAISKRPGVEPKYANLILGDLILTAGSQHLYDSDYSSVENILQNSDAWYLENPPVEHTYNIVEYLKNMKDFNGTIYGGFLDGLFQEVYKA
jgi:thymidylate synthase